jgi:hypothetical protein
MNLYCLDEDEDVDIGGYFEGKARNPKDGRMKRIRCKSINTYN